jgi:hypothetical protein
MERMSKMFNSFIPKDSKYGILDGDGELRFVSTSSKELIVKIQELNWGTLVDIKVSDKGIKFGKVIMRW